jgi:hypothetical protein
MTNQHQPGNQEASNVTAGDPRELTTAQLEIVFAALERSVTIATFDMDYISTMLHMQQEAYDVMCEALGRPNRSPGYQDGSTATTSD